MEINQTFLELNNGVEAVLFQSIERHENNQIAILIMHSDMSYLNFKPSYYLAKRGFTILNANVRNPDGRQDLKMLDVLEGVLYLKGLKGVQKVILLGHSGGATLMSAYQAIAQNGVEIFQNDAMVIQHMDIGKLIEADGIMLLDSNFGNGAMTLLSVDPSVDNYQLDIYDQDLTVPYSTEFKQQFFLSQGKRNNEIIKQARERLTLIEQGKGILEDDEPFFVKGASQTKPCNKMINQDITLFSHTKEAYPLLHKDHSFTNEVIYCTRKPWYPSKNPTHYMMGALSTTIKGYLSGRAVKALDHYELTDCEVKGIDWNSSYCNTPGNVQYINGPILIMGMVDSYEFLASELIYKMCPSQDKTIAFCEGIGHMLLCKDEQMNNAMYDYIQKWIEGRFK